MFEDIDMKKIHTWLIITSIVVSLIAIITGFLIIWVNSKKWG